MYISEKLHKKVIEYQRINKVRNRKKIAEKAGITILAFDNIINGKTSDPKVNTLEKICLVLGITLNELFDNPGWNTVSAETHMVAQPPETYKVPLKEQPVVVKLQDEIISLQKDRISHMETEITLKTELFEVKLENERLKNAYAQNQTARVGS